MSNRDDGFPIADISTTFLDDPKVRKLAKRCTDDGDLAAAIVVYMATLLASWREGRRLSFDEAESWVEPTPERIDNLKAVRLLDEEGRVPEAAWERYFKPAWERREKARAGGRIGNERRWGTDRPPITPPSGGDPRQTDRPSDHQTGNQSPRSQGDRDGKPWVLMTPQEQEDALQREKDELKAKQKAKLGVVA